MYQIPEKLKNVTPYEPNVGEYPIRLDANESFLHPTKLLQDEILNALSKVELRRYPDPMATEVTKLYSQYYNIDPRFVTASNGSDEMISIIINGFLQAGDKLCVAEPDFSMYRFYAEVSGVEVVNAGKNEDLTIDVDNLIKTVNDSGAKMLIFSNPCNPTSLGIKKDEVRKIINSVSALVVVDEAYMDFWDQSLINEIHNYDNAILLRTCSKMMGLAAIRLGFAVANEKLTNLLRAIKSPYNVNSLTQAAACAVLKNKRLIDSAVDAAVESRNELYLSIQQLQKVRNFTLYETCTNFVFIKTPRSDYVFEQLKSMGILIRKFNGYLRITAGTPEENMAVLRALNKI
ncbi:MAG: histidinol-phosphate transaminase [Clostridia bacterium]|nr:histidinol-phosphate transaminase [Clostridia bacterium]